MVSHLDAIWLHNMTLPIVIISNTCYKKGFLINKVNERDAAYSHNNSRRDVCYALEHSTSWAEIRKYYLCMYLHDFYPTGVRCHPHRSKLRQKFRNPYYGTKTDSIQSKTLKNNITLIKQINNKLNNYYTNYYTN